MAITRQGGGHDRFDRAAGARPTRRLDALLAHAWSHAGGYRLAQFALTNGLTIRVNEQLGFRAVDSSTHGQWTA
jgi:hypothetical protein